VSKDKQKRRDRWGKGTYSLKTFYTPLTVPNRSSPTGPRCSVPFMNSSDRDHRSCSRVAGSPADIYYRVCVCASAFPLKCLNRLVFAPGSTVHQGWFP
jgi:hypothetical protein